jgi:hypothetical protein
MTRSVTAGHSPAADVSGRTHPAAAAKAAAEAALGRAFGDKGEREGAGRDKREHAGEGFAGLLVEHR